VVRSVSKLAKIVYTRQSEPLGLGHAVLMAKELVGDEPFCVLLPDDIVDAKVPCMKQMVEAFEETQATILASEVVEGPAISAYGCLDCTRTLRESAAAGGEGDGGEAEVRGGAVAERDHWAIYFDAADLRDD
jgi:UTP-glucose-1-phosphate uridylyltransferase